MDLNDPRMKEIEALEKQVGELRQKLTTLKREVAREEVEDHELKGPGGAPVKLSELFGDKRDMLVVHNMGKSCPYCTLWADGLNGLVDHLEDRAAFVVVSPDSPKHTWRPAATIPTGIPGASGWSFTSSPIFRS